MSFHQHSKETPADILPLHADMHGLRASPKSRDACRKFDGTVSIFGRGYLGSPASRHSAVIFARQGRCSGFYEAGGSSNAQGRAKTTT
jgi:hypothetical protein